MFDSLNKYILGFLILVCASVWISVFTYSGKDLKLIACDVGQGDAILAVYGKTQILVDGGPGNDVLDCLGRHIPFWDREIDVIILTHPQKDHFGGLIEVFKKYKVNYLLANDLNSGSDEYGVLIKEVGGSGTRVVRPTSGMVMRLGLIHLDIVWPEKEFFVSNTFAESNSPNTKILGAYATNADPNIFSIVAILNFGEFDALLTGDIGPKEIDLLLARNLVIDVDYIKIPHHGSKNGITPDLLRISRPEIAVISAGKNNSYGHPHKEVLELLRDQEIKYFRTDEMGDVVIATDGKEIYFR